MKIYKRGEIYQADLTPVVGSEQGGTRPVLIIQNNKGNKFSPCVIIAIITKRTTKAQLPTHIWIDKSCGLRFDSMVELEQIRTIDKSRLGNYIGNIKPNEQKQIDKAIKISLGLGD